MLTVRIQEKNYSESIMVLKLKDGKPRPLDFTKIIIKPTNTLTFCTKYVILPDFQS